MKYFKEVLNEFITSYCYILGLYCKIGIYCILRLGTEYFFITFIAGSRNKEDYLSGLRGFAQSSALGYELVWFSSLLSGKEVPEQDEISAFKKKEVTLEG